MPSFHSIFFIERTHSYFQRCTICTTQWLTWPESFTHAYSYFTFLLGVKCFDKLEISNHKIFQMSDNLLTEYLVLCPVSVLILTFVWVSSVRYHETLHTILSFFKPTQKPKTLFIKRIKVKYHRLKITVLSFIAPDSCQYQYKSKFILIPTARYLQFFKYEFFKGKHISIVLYFSNISLITWGLFIHLMYFYAFYWPGYWYLLPRCSLSCRSRCPYGGKRKKINNLLKIKCMYYVMKK